MIGAFARCGDLGLGGKPLLLLPLTRALPMVMARH
jgi:hypothetical protein